MNPCACWAAHLPWGSVVNSKAAGLSPSGAPVIKSETCTAIRCAPLFLQQGPAGVALE